MKKIIFYSVIIIVLSSLCFYFFLPTLNFGFYGLPFIFLLLSGLLFLLENYNKKNNRNNNINSIIASMFWLSLSFIIIVPSVSTWAIFHHEKYKELIGDVKIGENFTNQVAPISNEEIRIVDKPMAYRLGDKVIGSIPSLGSQVDVGVFSIQRVNNKLYWVAPLLHSGFFKWQKNNEGTPGYIMVSATNERDVKLIQEINNKPIKIRYQTEAFFSDNLKRHIYFNGYTTTGFTDFTFEINDNGEPFWVVTLYSKQIGFSGKEAIGIIIVNPESGEINEYSIEDAPTWVDRIQPSEFVFDQIHDWGEYVEGYWNFANENKLEPSNGISLIYGSNNRSYWYTGITSVGSDEGTVGFILVDTRTKESIWYKQKGATEIAAQRSAMGKVQEKRYAASFPITYNINGIPTYVMSLKDNAGLIKMIAMVSVEDYTIVGVGNNMAETVRSYKNALNSNGNNIVPSSFSKMYSVEATVSRISSDIRNGNTFYYLILSDYENKLFIGSSLISNELPITQKGDSVRIMYDDNTNELIDIITFENLNFEL